MKRIIHFLVATHRASPLLPLWQLIGGLSKAYLTTATTRIEISRGGGLLKDLHTKLPLNYYNHN